MDIKRLKISTGGMSWNASDIHSLEFVFSLPYIPENSKILINEEETSVLFIEESKIIKDDFMGLYTSLKKPYRTRESALPKM